MYLMRRCLIRALHLLPVQSWAVITLLLVLLYSGGYASMLWFGEDALVDRYTWWFIVTVTTVGYGDISPVSYGGQVVAMIIMLFGIAILGLVMGKIIEGVIAMSMKKNKGLVPLKVSKHILIMGYHEHDTHKIVDEILGDADRVGRPIVLCSSQLTTNPFDPDKVGFIHGELASDDVLFKACASKADKVIVHGADDNQSFFTAYAVRQVNKKSHLVVYIQNEEHKKKIEDLTANHKDLNQVVLPSSTYLMVQEMQDPQASHVLQHLMSNLTGATLYRVDIPHEIDKEWSFTDIFLHFRKMFNSTVLAVKNGEIITNPPIDMAIKGGMSLFYVGEERVKNISWNEI